MNIIGTVKTKKELVDKYFETIYWTEKKCTKQDYVNVILSDYVGKIEDHLKVSVSTVTKLHKRIYLNKKSNNKPITYILDCYNYKCCVNCGLCLLKDNFNIHKSRHDGLQTICKMCEQNRRQVKDKDFFKLNTAKYRSAKLSATPKWLTEEQLQEMEYLYYNCPEGHQIDHIVPLRGKIVCGLHVPWNLQYLTEKENKEKSNKLI